MDAVKEKDAIAVLHDDVGEDEIEGVGSQKFEGFAAGRGQLDVIALALEGGADHGADMVLVINDENACRPASSGRGARAMVCGQWHHIPPLRFFELKTQGFLFQELQ